MHGNAESAVVTGNTVIWTDVRAVPSDARPNPAWAIRAENLSTGHVWALATSPEGRTSVPFPATWSHYVAWTAADPGNLSDHVVVYDLNTHTSRVVKRHLFAWGVAVTEGRLVFGDTRPDQRPKDIHIPPKAREVYSMPITGGATTDLGGGGNAHDPVAGDGYVVWGEPKYNDQHRIWVAPADGHAPARRIGPRIGALYNPIVGMGFIEFENARDGEWALPLDAAGKERPTQLMTHPHSEYDGSGAAVDGNRVSYATVTADGTDHELITLHVDKVTVDR